MASFGFSPADIISLITLAKNTYDDCRKAPLHFGEAGRGAKSLHLVFQSLESEVSKPDSLLNRDEQCKSHIKDIANNCKTVLTQLDEIVLKYASLGSAKIKPWDRFRLPRKEILEIQGKLRFHQTHLISYLEMIGVSAIGRVEQKFDLVGKSHEEVMEKFEVAGKSHEEVMDGLDAILRTVDKIGAEIRAGLHAETVFSDHSEDDKEVWNALRNKLIKQGFTSKFILPHEDKILERVKEMNEMGLFDSDAQVSSDDVGFDTEVPHGSYTIFSNSYQSATVATDAESGFESEATLPPRPSKQDLRRTTSCNIVRSSKRASTTIPGKLDTRDQKLDSALPFKDVVVSSGSRPKSDRPRSSGDTTCQKDSTHTTTTPNHSPNKGRQHSSTSLPDTTSRENSRLPESPKSQHGHRRSSASSSPSEGFTLPSIVNMDGKGVDVQTSGQVNTKVPSQKMRVWTGRDSRLKLKAEFLHRSGNYVHLREGDGGETIILASNLSRLDQEYMESLSTDLPGLDQPVVPPSPPVTNLRPETRTTSSAQPPQAALSVEPEIEVINREKPETFVGKRSRLKPIWKYRRIQSIPYRQAGYECDALPLAASKGQYQQVVKLLAKGANIESNYEMVTSTDSEGHKSTRRQRTTTALYRSAVAGYFNVAQLLLDNGANVETDNLLHKLASSGDIEFTRLLLEYNARPSRTAGSSRRTALHVAAHMGSVGIVDVLLEHGASINARDKMNETPLYLACMEDRPKIVLQLLKGGADTSLMAQDGQTALYKAGGRGYTDIVRRLLSYSADANLGRGVSGETTLFKAAKKGYTEAVYQLLRYGADPNLANDSKAFAAGSTLDTVILLLKPEDEARNNYGLRPLYAAAEAGHAEIVRLLLEHGALVDAPSPRSGQTALYAAARKGQRRVVDILVRAGAQLAPQAQVDDVLRLMNSGEGDAQQLVTAGGKDEKPKRVEMISVLLGRFSTERLGRGVDSWKKGEAVQGIELVTEVMRRIGEGRGESLRKGIL